MAVKLVCLQPLFVYVRENVSRLVGYVYGYVYNGLKIVWSYVPYLMDQLLEDPR